MGNHINWEEIRDKYIYGIQKDDRSEFPTVQDLAEEYGTARQTIVAHSVKGNWVIARKNYLTERRLKSDQKVVDEISNKIVPLDIYLFEKLDKFIRGIGGMIDGIFPNVEEGEALKPSEIISIKTSDLLNIINSLKQAKELEKSVLGEGGNGDNGNDIANILWRQIKGN
jgi:hypothetical protein